MKKILTLCTVLALAMSITLSSCGGGGDESGDPSTMSPISVSNENEWIATVALIIISGNNKAWTINVTSSFETGQNEWHSYTFGTVGNVTVTINGVTGNETISIRTSANDFIFKIYEKQTVVINNINLKGHATNEKPLVDVADTRATFTMTGTASISENNADVSWALRWSVKELLS